MQKKTYDLEVGISTSVHRSMFSHPDACGQYIPYYGVANPDLRNEETGNSKHGNGNALYF